MLINKSKYINKYVFCNSSVVLPLQELEKFLDDKLEQYNVSDDVEENTDEDLDFSMLWDEIKFIDQKEVKQDDKQLLITLEQGNLLEVSFRQAVIERFKLDHINLKDIKNVHEAAKATQEALDKGTGIIFEATFIYNNGTHDAVARVDAYIPSKNLMIEFKGTSSSKMKYYFDIGYQYKIIKACGYKIDACELSLIDYVRSNKADVKIAFTNKCHTGKSAKDVTGKKKLELSYEQLLKEKADCKQGRHVTYPIIDIIKQPNLLANKKGILTDGHILFCDFMSGELDNDFDEIANMTNNSYEMTIESCANPIASCPFINKCKAINKHENKWLDYSGFVIPLKIALGEDDPAEYLQEVKCKKTMEEEELIDALLNNNNVIRKEEVIEQFVEPIKNNKVVWFDFETINPAVAVVDNSLPFSQQVFQNSFIRWDENGNEVAKENQIIDTQKIDIEWYKHVIKSLYWEGAKYVVWNKSFENARLKEMANMIKQQEYYDMVDQIVNNVIDLADPFTIKTKCSFKLTQVLIGKLHGFYSIKKVEKYVSENNLPMKDIIIPYKELPIANGGMALSEGLARFFKITDDSDWNRIEKDLKDYCENDVKCMIMAYEFIKYLCVNN